MALFRRSPVAQFAVSGLAAMGLIGLVTVAVSREIGTQEAVRDAKHTTQLAGLGIVEPNLNAAVLAGDRAALSRLDEVVRRRVLGGGIVRVKIWTADGRVVYSDERRLIGARFALDDEEVAALGRHEVEAHVSDLSQPENRFERSYHKLLEVYRPIRFAGGQPLLFEVYQRFSSVSASGRRLWLAFAPAFLGGLALLQLVNLPLARSLVRRLRSGQEERESLLHRALDASQGERRVIAGDLHDGIVQDLLGVSFSLAAAANRLDGHRDAAAGAALRQGAARTRDSVGALRTLLIDLYPPNLHEAGLADALSDLAASYTARGLQTTIGISPDLRPGWTTERLLFRCAQETLRNAHMHANARAARLTVCTDENRVIMEVGDDGRGFDPGILADRPQAGHFGMRMLGDLVEDAGGQLHVQSALNTGTTVRVEVPR